MSRDTRVLWLRRVFRSLAVVIAIAAVIDPAIRSARRTRPVLSLVAADASRDHALLTQVTRRLEEDYTLVAAPLPSAIGTVLVGARLPDGAHALASPVVVVSPFTGRPSVSIGRIQAPTSAKLESRITVSVTLVTSGFASSPPTPRAFDVELVREGVVVSRQRISVAHDTTRSVSLTYVPSAPGPVVLQVRTFAAEQSDTARSDVLVDVRENRWSVLFFDRRPAWMSTFVRRALEHDPRFAVTSRVITSTNVSRETGRPPAGLDVIVGTSRFDAVVIGAPDALTARDVDGIASLLRTRGSSVLVLADHAATGPADVLLDYGGWRTRAFRSPALLSASTIADRTGDPPLLKGLAFGVPRHLPRGAVPLAMLRDTATSASRTSGADSGVVMSAPTIIWRVPVGLGQLVVSGAFDAWRFRDSSQSRFDATWRDLIGELANQRQMALELRLSRSLTLPRAVTTIEVTPRDTANATPIVATIRPTDASTDSVVSLSLEAGTSGVWQGTMRAPEKPGQYEVLAVQGLDSVRSPLVVAARVARDADDNPMLLAAWAASRGGQVIARDSVASLSRVLEGVLRPVPRITEWHPMRSPWWVVPFALALAAEWWMRRRRGLA